MRNLKTFEGYTIGPNSFKEGDTIIYTRQDSKYYNMIGKFVDVREDGKYRIIFLDNDIKLAASPQYVKKYKDDLSSDYPNNPYKPENWDISV